MWTLFFFNQLIDLVALDQSRQEMFQRLCYAAHHKSGHQHSGQPSTHQHQITYRAMHRDTTSRVSSRRSKRDVGHLRIVAGAAVTALDVRFIRHCVDALLTSAYLRHGRVPGAQQVWSRRYAGLKARRRAQGHLFLFAGNLNATAGAGRATNSCCVSGDLITTPSISNLASGDRFVLEHQHFFRRFLQSVHPIVTGKPF